MSRIQDTLGLIRGLQVVAEASIKLQEDSWRQVWQNSSIRNVANQVVDDLKKTTTISSSSETSANKTGTNSTSSAGVAGNTRASSSSTGNPIAESLDRINSVVVGVREFANLAATNFAPQVQLPQKEVKSSVTSANTSLNQAADSASTAAVSSLKTTPLNFQIKLTEKDKELLKKLDMEHQKKQAGINANEYMDGKKSSSTSTANRTAVKQEELAVNLASCVSVETEQIKPNPKVSVVPNPKSKLKLSASAKQRAVPSSRVSRMVSFGTLAAGLGVGTVAEYTKRAVGLGDSNSNSNPFLNQGNMDRIVDTLCKVRGAALKLGQIMSIQDESFISPELAKALERVRQSADFMPGWQVDKVMQEQLGSEWRSKLLEFDEKPFAAASIGQVHWAKTLSGEEVAIKIQYPGVARGIESDIENLLGIMKVWNIFPKGMFVDNVADVAKRELAWEVDYIREADCTKKFRELVKNHPDFYVPKVIDELSAAQVFTTQLVEGIPVDQCVNLDQEERNFIGEKILELCLLELMEFLYMQTDPNWANFLYNRDTKKIVLLDFGASREYSKQFMDNYIRIIKAAADGNKKTVLESSRDIGFLTGYENKAMEEAHVEAVMILGEVFRQPGRFDFGTQNTTTRIQDLVPTMIANRLCPPPEEIYSIHRKISGIFLLCLKLKASIRSQEIFNNIYKNYQFLY